MTSIEIAALVDTVLNHVLETNMPQRWIPTTIATDARIAAPSTHSVPWLSPDGPQAASANENKPDAISRRSVVSCKEA
jgi:hypothetical protein